MLNLVSTNATVAQISFAGVRYYGPLHVPTARYPYIKAPKLKTNLRYGCARCPPVGTRFLSSAVSGYGFDVAQPTHTPLPKSTTFALTAAPEIQTFRVCRPRSRDEHCRALVGELLRPVAEA